VAQNQINTSPPPSPHFKRDLPLRNFETQRKIAEMTDDLIAITRKQAELNAKQEAIEREREL
jgi:hypothetical protein